MAFCPQPNFDNIYLFNWIAQHDYWRNLSSLDSTLIPEGESFGHSEFNQFFDQNQANQERLHMFQIESRSSLLFSIML